MEDVLDLGDGISREQRFGGRGRQNPEFHQGIFSFTRSEKHPGVLQQGLRFPVKIGICGVDGAVQPILCER